MNRHFFCSTFGFGYEEFPPKKYLAHIFGILSDANTVGCLVLWIASGKFNPTSHRRAFTTLIFPCWKIWVALATRTIIDQIHKKPRFSSDWNPEQFSCGLLFKAGACFLPRGRLFKENSSENIFLRFIELKFAKRGFHRSVHWVSCDVANDDHKGSQRQPESRAVVGGTKENAMGEGARWMRCPI